MDIKFTFVNKIQKLKGICQSLSKEKVIGVDLECENNLHHYGVSVTLIQISTKSKNYIIDTVILKDISPLLKIFENPNIEKIFHDVSFDLRMLNYCYNSLPKNIYDTQLAAALLGRAQIGLGQLLEEYFNVKKESKFQMANWVKRPISESMLEYAINDTIYLIRLKEFLDKELKEKGRLEWAKEEFKNLESKDWSYNQGTFLDMRGIKQISDNERGIAKELYDLRESLAKKVNRPTHFIIGNKKLIEIATNPILDIKKWQNMKGVHPIVKNRAKQFLIAILKGKDKKVFVQRVKRKKYNTKQIARFTQINEVKDKISEELDLPKHLIVDKEDAKHYALTGDLDSFSKWQRDLIEKEL